MLTVEVKINNTTIAKIEAQKTRTISDKPGDFVGDRATVCEYRCKISYLYKQDDKAFSVIHDRRFGWEGLLNKITEIAMPIVIDTIYEEDLQ